MTNKALREFNNERIVSLIDCQVLLTNWNKYVYILGRYIYVLELLFSVLWVRCYFLITFSSGPLLFVVSYVTYTWGDSICRIFIWLILLFITTIAQGIEKTTLGKCSILSLFILKNLRKISVSICMRGFLSILMANVLKLINWQN